MFAPLAYAPHGTIPLPEPDHQIVSVQAVEPFSVDFSFDVSVKKTMPAKKKRKFEEMTPSILSCSLENTEDMIASVGKMFTSFPKEIIALIGNYLRRIENITTFGLTAAPPQIQPAYSMTCLFDVADSSSSSFSLTLRTRKYACCCLLRTVDNVSARYTFGVKRADSTTRTITLEGSWHRYDLLLQQSEGEKAQTWIFHILLDRDKNQELSPLKKMEKLLHGDQLVCS